MQLKTRGKSVMTNKGTMQNIYGLFFFSFFFPFFFSFSSQNGEKFILCLADT